MDALTRERYFPTKKSKPKGVKKQAINRIQLDVRPVEYSRFKQNISFSQYSLYKSCPRAWYLKYGKKLKREDVPNMSFVFGTALHTVLQEYLKVSFDESGTKADEIDFGPRFRQELYDEFSKTVEKLGVFSSIEEVTDYYLDGVSILNYFRSHRREYFNLKNMILLGIELPLQESSEENPNVGFVGFIDIIFYDTVEDAYYVFDIKTSTRGWKFQKKDPKKVNQVLFYKHFLAKQYGIDINKIKPVFLILKRKLYEDSPYKQSRIQWFEPASSARTVKKVIKEFDQFISECYSDSGEIISNRDYPAIQGDRKFNCTYCPFADNETLCPLKERK